jgi:hypothetical protein
MATESSEPRTGLIIRLSLLCIGTLLVVHGVLGAYFDRMAKAEELRKRGALVPEALDALRADEKTRLSSGGMPIDKAMQTLAEKGRMNASTEITPSVSKDNAPLQGWSQLPNTEGPSTFAAPPAPEPAPATSALSDAGAAPGAKPDARPQKPARPTHK